MKTLSEKVVNRAISEASLNTLVIKEESIQKWIEDYLDPKSPKLYPSGVIPFTLLGNPFSEDEPTQRLKDWVDYNYK